MNTMLPPAPSRLLRCAALALGFLCITLIAPLHGAERDSLKLLTIGNSFANDALGFLPQLAESGGKTLVVGRANLGGCSLERHARHLAQAEAGDPAGRAYTSYVDPETGKKRAVTLPEALSAQAWDIVTIQQWSMHSFRPETFQPHADQLIAAVRKYAPTAEIVVHETWAYRLDHGIFQKDDQFTPRKMYEGLRDAYRQLAASRGLRLLPVGDAFELARATPRWTYAPDANFDFANPPAGQLPDQRGSLNAGWRWAKDKEGVLKFANDAIHCNTAGRYLGAAVWYQVLFEAGTVPETFTPEGLSSEDAADLRRHAAAAVVAQRRLEKEHTPAIP